MPQHLKRPASPLTEQVPAKKPWLDDVDRASLRPLPNTIEKQPNGPAVANSTPMTRNDNIERRPVAQPHRKQYHPRMPGHGEVLDHATSTKQALINDIDKIWGDGWYEHFYGIRPPKKKSPEELAKNLLEQILIYARWTEVDRAVSEVRDSIKLRRYGKHWHYKHLQGANKALCMITEDFKHLNEPHKLPRYRDDV